MLPFLSRILTPYWGPFRLFGSHLFLICAGGFLAALFTWIFLPKFWKYMPHDQGKSFVANSQLSKGKPTGAGFILVLTGALVLLLILPPNWHYYGILFSLVFAMLTGFLDDRSAKPWGQLKKGLLDLASALIAAVSLVGLQDTSIWLPFFKGPITGGAFPLSVYVAIPIATILLWFSINAVNCSDGVDGLAGSLALFALFCIGVFLYGVIGNTNVASYLLIPHLRQGAALSLFCFTTCGILCGYLWFNAPPSQVMMGDAGSRFLGLLIGIGALATKNPFMLVVFAPILLVNGGTGLVKLVLLRCLKKLGLDVRQPLANVPNPIHPENFATEQEAKKQLKFIRLLHKVRFPLHDQCRKNWKWSDSQVLVRFMLLQAILTPLFIIIFLKLR